MTTEYAVLFTKNLREFSFRQPSAEELKREYAFVKLVHAEGKESVFMRMQGEVWSPNGEARPLIEKLGLSHTSMSNGDVLIDTKKGEAWYCDFRGYKMLPMTDQEVWQLIGYLGYEEFEA